MKNILTIGSACQDMFIDYKNRDNLALSNPELKNSIILREGEKVDIDNIFYSLGGGAVNSALSFKKLGFNVSTIFKLGIDQTGEYILGKLSEIGIITKDIILDKNIETAKSFIFSTQDHNYTALCFRGSNQSFDFNDVKYKLDKFNYDLVYITSLSSNFTRDLEYFIKKIKRKETLISFNPGISQLVKDTSYVYGALKYIDVFVLNALEAKSYLECLLNSYLIDLVSYNKIITDLDTPELFYKFLNYKNKSLTIEFFFKQILKKGPKIVIVTNGKEGVYLATQDFILFYPSIETEVLSTLGAGDAFSSCFIASLMLDVSVEKSLIYGAINSSSVISCMNANQGLLGLPEIEQKFKKINYKLLKKFVI
ncbi:carbohydrate kinase family protein [Candidatus Babela massiliensis]|uniref:Sugar kinase ribokinase family n=1 Tax=Candidatus Babela massiliensis TaxID=673862 RepID=V6DIK5_9BACT|nr:carbohydrate kinase family protein [Candidatus Babela massiliensis]CDK30758.1 Sugar kinase ribokinase family [Candidatus Babela massiliensis]